MNGPIAGDTPRPRMPGSMAGRRDSLETGAPLERRRAATLWRFAIVLILLAFFLVLFTLARADRPTPMVLPPVSVIPAR